MTSSNQNPSPVSYLKNPDKNTVICVNALSTKLGGKFILDNISFEIKKCEITAIIGGSGCGKSSLLKQMLCLLKPHSGIIEIFGKNILKQNAQNLAQIQMRCGVCFQQNALFSSLNVLENIIFPLRNFTRLNIDTMIEIALLKLSLVGLPPDSAYQSVSALSGGMQKRVALARALALDPELLFLDEPSSGLDPVSAKSQDKLLLALKKSLGLTVVLVTHDLNTLENIADKIIFLGEKKILAIGSFMTLKNHAHPEIHEYFSREF